MIPQNKKVRQLVWHLLFVVAAVASSELYCYKTEGDGNSVVSQASCRMDVTHTMSKFTYGEACVIQDVPRCW